jgi:hypothetical protein
MPHPRSLEAERPRDDHPDVRSRRSSPKTRTRPLAGRRRRQAHAQHALAHAGAPGIPGLSRTEPPCSRTVLRHRTNVRGSSASSVLTPARVPRDIWGQLRSTKPRCLRQRRIDQEVARARLGSSSPCGPVAGQLAPETGRSEPTRAKRKVRPRACNRLENRPFGPAYCDGACRDRTGDLQLAKLALSQLS